MKFAYIGILTSQCGRGRGRSSLKRRLFCRWCLLCSFSHWDLEYLKQKLFLCTLQFLINGKGDCFWNFWTFSPCWTLIIKCRGDIFCKINRRIYTFIRDRRVSFCRHVLFKKIRIDFLFNVDFKEAWMNEVLLPHHHYKSVSLWIGQREIFDAALQLQPQNLFCSNK